MEMADENPIERPNCNHGKQTAIKRVKKDGPNEGRLFFAVLMKCPADIFNGRAKKNL